ncbi:MAG: NAD(+) diphosphatase [Burkholderiales bacterium]
MRDRVVPDLYVPLYTPPPAQDAPALWFTFQRSSILVQSVESATLPCCRALTDHGIEPVRSTYLGMLGERHCYAAEVDESHPLPEGWATLGLRDLFSMVDGTVAALSGRAFQLLEWERNHQYCSRCGTPMEQRSDERARACPACRYTTYPLVSPAVMVLVTRGRELLLARKGIWPPGRYSAIAGFVEPGEMLEDTVARETREEVGVEVGALRYFGSQPWPFPHSLMVAFTAEYAGGKVTPDGVEIEEAAWFDAEALPRLPPSVSISRRLITTVAAELAQQYPRDRG